MEAPFAAGHSRISARSFALAKPELGTKRICGTCGSKFYDLSKDPIICPKCGSVYQVVTTAARARPEPIAPKVVPEEEAEPKKPAHVELVSLEEADAEASGKKKAPAAAEAESEDDVEIPAAAEDDTFLEEEEEEPGNVSDILGEKLEGEEET
jgi:uncharacterized protein (TIGR02300 family)